MDSDIRQLIWDRAKKYYPVKASHGLNHIEDNLNMAEKMLAFAKEPFTDQIYAAIVFHDSGLEKYGREIHEVHSAEIAKRELKDLFSSKDLYLIAAAIREHRASFKGKFTSMLSDICSSADRNAPHFESTVARSFLYTSEHHPEFDFDEKCRTVADHLCKKYGTSGYARFPIYYSRYYRNDLRSYQKKMDMLTGDIVAGIVGPNGKNAEKLYDKALEEFSCFSTESVNRGTDWIKSVNDIKEFYRNCLYGMIDYRKNPPVCIPAEKTSNFDWIFGYKFSSVEDTVKYNCGTCLNAAYVADKFLSDWKIEHESIFIHPVSKWDLRPQTHCCVLYKHDGKWRLLDSIPEMIDNNLIGTTYKDLAKQVVSMHCKAYGKDMTYSLITRYPEVGSGIFKVLSCTDDWVDGKLVKTFGNDLKDAVTVFKNVIYSIGSFSQESLSDKVETNIVDNKVYHASPFKLDKLSGPATKSWSGEKGSVFVSPFKGLVSCFVINKDGVLKIAQEQLGGRLVGLNFGYDVWNWPTDRLRTIPSKVTILLNVKGLKTFSGESTGYIYTIDYNKYKDKTHMFNKNKNSDVEFLIEGDVQYLKCEKITVKWECKSSVEEIARKGEAKIVSMEEFATEALSTKEISISPYKPVHNKQQIVSIVNRIGQNPSGNNCQRHAIAFVLAVRNNEYRRFEDVTSPFDIVFDTIINKAFEFKNWFISKSVELQSIQSLFDRQAPFISIVAVKWKKGNGGHVFNVIRTDNETYVVDCQEKKVELASASKYLDKNEIDYNDSFVLDMTHAVLDRELIDISFGLSNRKFFLNGNGPYKSIIEGLAKLDAANTTYTVSMNNTVIGRIRCGTRTDENYNFIDSNSPENRVYYVYKYHWVSCNIPSTESLSTEAINAEVEQNIVETKMYFANNNGKVPSDGAGRYVLVKNLRDACIYAAFDDFDGDKSREYCSGITSTNHVLVQHGDDSHKPSVTKRVSGDIYEVSFKSTVEFMYNGNRGIGKCKLPKTYVVRQDGVDEFEIKKLDPVSIFATYEFNSEIQNFAQENFGPEDDLFVENVIKPKIRDNTLYHGSRDKFSVIKAQQISELKDKGIKSISLTPYKRLASLFCIPLRSLGTDKNGKSLYKHRRIKLDEWFDDVSEDDKYKVVKTVHVTHNIPDIDPIDEYYTGYLYYVDADQALRNAGKNPINGKGPNEVLCFDKELKPYKIEQIRVRWIARYSKSFSREEGGDAIPVDLFDPSLEDFNGEYMENFAQEGFFDKLKNAILSSGNIWYACVIDNASSNTPKDAEKGLEVFKDWNTAIDQAIVNHVMDSKDVVHNGDYSLVRNGNNVVLKCDKKCIKSARAFKGNVTVSVLTLTDNEVDDANHIEYGPYPPNNAKRKAVVVQNVNPSKYFICKDNFTLEVKLVNADDVRALEDFNDASDEFVDSDIGIQMLSEFNAGIEEFNRWVRDIELYQLKKDLNDPQVDMVFSQIAQENILLNTVKEIFQKIAQFISWFLRKLKDLWNYFFGKTQRAMRALKASHERITKHKNSNGFFNDGAYTAFKAPQNLVSAIGFDKFIISGFLPDEYNRIFEEILNMWAKDPQELYEELFVRFSQTPTTHKWKLTHFLMPIKHNNAPISASKKLMICYPASGSMGDSGYNREVTLVMLKNAMDICESYTKNSKLISSKGNIVSDAARRAIEYQDRSDITEQEAMKMAKEVQELGNVLHAMFKGYQESFEFILGQANLVAGVYQKFMQ